ncbi:kinase-like domain-containing protein [Rhizophagus irregularis DAOM 181602=DAOM 197198]|nr:kinase-like domain-containing protein [Rhizophagus irregularis DAOM 181602=DAOM 197198]
MSTIRYELVYATTSRAHSLIDYKNVESANQSWFEEAKSHLTINNKWTHDDYNLAMDIINEEEQEAFHSKTYDFNIPDNIEDFNNSNDQKINKTSKINSIFKGGSKRLSKVFKRLQINSNNDIQNDHKKETTQQKKGSVNDDDEIHNNPNLHSEDQDEFEIPDDGF